MVMQPVSSHLRKNPKDDNEPRASQLLIFCIFLGVADDDEPPWLIVILFFLGVADDGEPPWFVIISLFFFIGVVDDNGPPCFVVISLFFFSSVANDGELRASLSFLNFFSQGKRQ
jgi:hypothetical protein